MAFIRTLTMSNTLERTKEKFYGFRQTVLPKENNQKLVEKISKMLLSLKMAVQRRSHIYVVLPRSFAVVSFIIRKLQT